MNLMGESWGGDKAVEKDPDKTFIDRITKGFDFLGYSFQPKRLSIAPKTLANFLKCEAYF